MLTLILFCIQIDTFHLNAGEGVLTRGTFLFENKHFVFSNGYSFMFNLSVCLILHGCIKFKPLSGRYVNVLLLILRQIWII